MTTTQVGWLWTPVAPGVIVPQSSMSVPINAHVVHYASSVFEGIRVYPALGRNERLIFRLQDHLDRLWNSAEHLGLWPLPFARSEVEAACLEVLMRNHEDTYLRPVIFRGEGLGVNPLPSPICAAVITAKWGKYLQQGEHHDGVSVFVSDFCRPRPDQMPPGKLAANYAVNSLVKAQAITAGYAEGLLRAPDGRHLAEGTGMNLVVVKDRRLITPDVTSCRLAGITLNTVGRLARELLGTIMEEDSIREIDLYQADEAFLTGTATEITPITKVGELEIGPTTRAGRMGPVTKNLQQLYLNLVRGRLDFHPEWLTRIPSHAFVDVPGAAA